MTPGWVVSSSLLLIMICTGCVGGAEQWVYKTDKPTKHWTCVSNGFMGVKVPTEGQGWTTKEQARLRPHIIAGHWTYFGKDGMGTERGQWRAATDAVIWSEVGYNDGKAWLDASMGEMADYSQSIDIKRSVVRTRFR
ncbi:MAG: hypothetical protein QF662_02205, partial [Phycisphaerae bacterium]|nr:hypothetical protein [Phycisphaerae bacterium]